MRSDGLQGTKNQIKTIMRKSSTRRKKEIFRGDKGD